MTMMMIVMMVLAAVAFR